MYRQDAIDARFGIGPPRPGNPVSLLLWISCDIMRVPASKRLELSCKPGASSRSARAEAHANLDLDYDALEASWQELPLAEAPRLREIERATRDEDEHMRYEGCGTQDTSRAQATEKVPHQARTRTDMATLGEYVRHGLEHAKFGERVGN